MLVLIYSVLAKVLLRRVFTNAEVTLNSGPGFGEPTYEALALSGDVAHTSLSYTFTQSSGIAAKRRNDYLHELWGKDYWKARAT